MNRTLLNTLGGFFAIAVTAMTAEMHCFPAPVWAQRAATDSAEFAADSSQANSVSESTETPDAGPAIRTYRGRRIVLITDATSPAESRALVSSFDAAVPQWRDFWGMTNSELGDFKVTACVMTRPEVFAAAGLIPSSIPPVRFGYAAGRQLWVVKQPGAYYTRHLLLHEGVHALMFDQFGGTGPSWFAEGTAELLSVHRGVGTNIRVNQIPEDRSSSQFWGRIKIIKQRREAGEIPTLESVMKYPTDLNADPEAYAWSWAAAMVFASHAQTRPAFVAAGRIGRDRSAEFNRLLYRRVREEWPVIVARWRLLVHDLDFGFDWKHQQTRLASTDPAWNGRERTTVVRASESWQSAGVRLAPGSIVELSASGRCTIAAGARPARTQAGPSHSPGDSVSGDSVAGPTTTFSPKRTQQILHRPWQSEPRGVTLRYFDSAPLGQLQAILLPIAAKPIGENLDRLAPLKTVAVGTAVRLEIPQPCWLVLRVNDAAGERGDNSGEYRVVMRAVPR